MNWLSQSYAEFRAPLDAMLMWAAGLCVLAVWAACSSLHWFVRALILVLAIAAMLPIRADEPVVLFLVVAPATVLLMTVIRRLFASSWVESVSGNEALAVRARIGIRVMVISYTIFVVLWLMAVFLPMLSGLPWTYPLNWFEWASFGVLVVGSLVVTVLVKRGRRPPPVPAETDQKEMPRGKMRVRFDLRDLLLSVVIVAMLSAILATVMARSLILDWLGMLGSAACIVIVTVTSACVVLLRRGWVYWALAMLLAIAGSTALHTWLLSVWIDFEMVFWMAEWPVLIVTFSSAFAALAAVVMIGTYLLLAADILAGPRRPVRDQHPVTRATRIVASCMCLAIYAPLLVVYWRMLAVLPVPEYALPETNAYPQIISAVNRLAELIPNETTVSQIRDPAKRKEVKETYDSLMKILAKPAFIPMELKRDALDEYYTEQLLLVQNLRVLAQAWESEGTVEQSLGQFDRAAEYGLATILLAGTQQKGGVIFSTIMGAATERIGVNQLSGVRNDISIQQTEQLLEQLAEVERNREPRRVTSAREAAWNDRAYTWRNSLLREAPVLLASLERDEYEVSWTNSPGIQMLDDAMDHRDALLQLLITELAIRLFQHDNDRLPELLEQLTPDYLSAVPLDPYSGDPLVYRRTGDSYVLYSVGQDGDDNGGTFGTEMFSPGFDLDLDVYNRINPPVEARQKPQEQPEP